MTNREIKFRAWDKEIDRMFDLGSVPAIISGTRELAPEEHWITCTDHVLMQYTGLKDKNGVEIYEGDLIKATGEHPAEVGFRFGTFILRHVNHTGMNGVSISDVATDRYEVIGNTYENPELLNK